MQVAAEMVAEGCQVEAAMAAVVRVWEAAVRVEGETEAVAVGRVRAVEVTVLAVVATGEEAAGMAVVEMVGVTVGAVVARALAVQGLAMEETEQGTAVRVARTCRSVHSPHPSNTPPRYMSRSTWLCHRLVDARRTSHTHQGTDQGM